MDTPTQRTDQGLINRNLNRAAKSHESVPESWDHERERYFAIERRQYWILEDRDEYDRLVEEAMTDVDFLDALHRIVNEPSADHERDLYEIRESLKLTAASKAEDQLDQES